MSGRPYHNAPMIRDRATKIWSLKTIASRANTQIDLLRYYRFVTGRAVLAPAREAGQSPTPAAATSWPWADRPQSVWRPPLDQTRGGPDARDGGEEGDRFR